MLSVKIASVTWPRPRAFIGHGVGVQIQRGVHVGMSEHGLNCLRVSLRLGDKERRETVPQVMEAESLRVFDLHILCSHKKATKQAPRIVIPVECRTSR